LTQCSGNGYQTCGDYNSDGCTEWSGVTNCASGQTCSSGACSSVCSNECVMSGATQCSGTTGYQTCGNYDSDSCLEWSTTVTACPSGQTCSNGSCGGCASHASKKCDSGNLYWYNSCGAKEELSQNCGTNSTTANYRCSGVWLQRQTIIKDCVNGACVEEPSWENITDCSLTGKVCKDSACVSGDTVAPALSSLGPTGTIYDSSSATLAVTTSEAAECRYSWYDKSFDAMTLKFSTSDHLRHSASASLINFGNYNYYVRCRDSSGNVNAIAGRIMFRYASSQPVCATPPVVQPPKDATPPTISNLLPAGAVSNPNVTISADTDEDATCKYDTADTAYDAMQKTMSGSTTHTDSITLPETGSYTYYIRCSDKSGNKNNQSAKISFSYAPTKEGPKISNSAPSGAVYQNSVTLAVTTDKPSDCRYSTDDKDYDLMQDSFSVSDGQQQTAIVALNDYGSYTYFVRCKDTDGNKDTASTVISFEYQDSNAHPIEPGGGDDNKTTKQPAITCDQVTGGPSDNTCDPNQDCVCDPDCGKDNQPQDADCANVSAKVGGANPAAIILISLGAFIIVAVVIVALIIKRKNSGRGKQSIMVPTPGSFREVPKI
jgi:hypothetical protein